MERKAHKEEVQGLKAQLWDRTLSESSAVAPQGGTSTGGKRLASGRAGPQSKRIHTGYGGSSEELVETVPTLLEGSSNGYYRCLVPDPTDPLGFRYMEQSILHRETTKLLRTEIAIFDQKLGKSQMKFR